MLKIRILILDCISTTFPTNNYSGGGESLSWISCECTHMHMFWNIRLLASAIMKWESEANEEWFFSEEVPCPSHHSPMAPEGESHGCHPRKPPALMQACHLLSIWDKNERLSLKKHLSCSLAHSHTCAHTRLLLGLAHASDKLLRQQFGLKKKKKRLARRVWPTTWRQIIRFFCLQFCLRMLGV